MYSQEEASRLRQAFWTAFGLYMAPVLSAEGSKTNWVNYKTGEKHVYFRMQAGSGGASIAIELTHPDAGLQHLYFEQLLQLKPLLQNALGEPWHWQPQFAHDNGKLVSRVYKNLEGVSVFRKTDWPALISFFKPRLLALDAFWSEARYSFEALR